MIVVICPCWHLLSPSDSHWLRLLGAACTCGSWRVVMGCQVEWSSWAARSRGGGHSGTNQWRIQKIIVRRSSYRTEQHSLSSITETLNCFGLHGSFPTRKTSQCTQNSSNMCCWAGHRDIALWAARLWNEVGPSRLGSRQCTACTVTASCDPVFAQAAVLDLKTRF